MMDEHYWVKEIARGNEQGLKTLYQQYSARVYNTAISYTKNADDAQELLQDVFITLFKTAQKFRSDASVSTWIYRITVNKSLDFLRKKNSLKRGGIFTSIYKSGTTEVLHQSVDFDHPGVKLENKEDAALLFRAIEKLSDNQKTAFILTQIEGLSQKEAASIMKTTPKSVESLLQRAKAKLRVDLEEFYPGRGKTGKTTSK